MPNQISKETEKLIGDYKEALDLEKKYNETEEEKIKVHQVSSRIAFLYERVRNAVDYKEEHLLRKQPGQVFELCRRVLKGREKLLLLAVIPCQDVITDESQILFLGDVRVRLHPARPVEWTHPPHEVISSRENLSRFVDGCERNRRAVSKTHLRMAP